MTAWTPSQIIGTVLLASALSVGLVACLWCAVARWWRAHRLARLRETADMQAGAKRKLGW
jgi:hypothetical protein